ncbi:MAG: FAD-binding oxidoreductase [Sphingomonadaceae bacterium]
MDRSDLLEELTRVVGREGLFAGLRDRLVYRYDATGGETEPLAVVFPADAAEAAAVVRIAHRKGIPVVVRGAGTNLSGGTVPQAGGVVLVCTRMSRILEIDVASERAVVEAGVVNLDLQNALAPVGYLFAPDPSSQKVSTLGGNVGENAGGPHCLKYGITSDHVIGLEVVLADGRVVHTGGLVEDTPGYDLTGLLVGSEGTLGVVTSMALRLMRAPEAIKTMLAIFGRLEDAGDAVSEMIAEGIVPATLEIMDRTIVEAIEASGASAGYPVDAEGVLLIELDGLAEGQDRQAERIVEICRSHHARDVRVARTEAERNQLWMGRRAAYSALVSLAPGSSIHDTTVPRTRLAETLHKVREIAQRYGLTIGTAAHAGDGNLHPLVVYDTEDPEEMERVRRADREIVELSVEMGGTLTGEHGIGLEKRDYMPLLFGDLELNLMRQLKRVFDPEGLLNPGKLLPG